MEAIRQIISVKNHSVTVVLPDDFTADKVEVIILPVQNDEYQVPQWQIDQVRERTENYLKNPKNVTDIDDFLKEIEDEL
ncbi:hypothetical protein K6T82_00065 [Flavobacterium sp. 17A]|jgi:hypothetical protein|uniref:Addiction module component n=1 Tax=Flavobacterium potami TaxID=2872310 RepID=A0A9X1KM02_9FLAO|nr:hypothetical protein [Flavobacterium potami]MBZ4033143.1 hypothetical protein [Flavobacterium potami]